MTIFNIHLQVRDVDIQDDLGFDSPMLATRLKHLLAQVASYTRMTITEARWEAEPRMIPAEDGTIARVDFMGDDFHISAIVPGVNDDPL